MRKDVDPYLDAGVRGWIVKTAKKNFWRVAGWYDFDDLVQDGYFCWAKCRVKFPYGIEPCEDDFRLFMRFFQRSFFNHIIDLANERTETPELAIAALPEMAVSKLDPDCPVRGRGRPDNVVEAWADSTSDLGDAGLMTLLAQAPAEIADMLKKLLVDGVANVPYLRKGKARVRETSDEHYDRCLGKPGACAKIRNYFLGNELSGDYLIDRLVESLFNNNME